MKRNEKHKSLSKKVDIGYNEIRNLADKLNTDYNTIAKGYMVQPIYIERIIGDTYKITGDCSLDNNKCVHSVSLNSYYDCSMCPTYKAYFKVNKYER